MGMTGKKNKYIRMLPKYALFLAIIVATGAFALIQHEKKHNISLPAAQSVPLTVALNAEQKTNPLQKTQKPKTKITPKIIRKIKPPHTTKTAQSDNIRKITKPREENKTPAEKEKYCLALAVYFEARSEPKAGQQAVAETVLNRVKSKKYPNTVCHVVFQNENRKHKCQFSFACDGKTDKPKNKKAWKIAQNIAEVVISQKNINKIVRSATHYHADYVSPKWARNMKKTIQIGRHIFYSAL